MPEESGDIAAEALLAAAQEYDAAVEAGETPTISVEEVEPEKTQEEETPAPEEPVEVEEEKPPETEGDNADKEDGSLTDGEAPEEQEKSTKSKSKYARNRARLDKTWAGVNEAKEQNKRDRAELAEAKVQLERERTESAALNGYRDEHGHTAEDYAEAAKGFEDEGETGLRDAARAKVKELSLKETEVTQKAQVDKWTQGWVEGRKALEREMPELTDANATLTKAANDILKANPELFQMSEAKGLRQAVKMAQYKLKADKADSSHAEAKELSDKLTKLEKKTSVTGGFTSDRPDGERAFSDLSDDEQENFLRRAALAHDESL